MTALASRQEIHKILDGLPPEALPDLLDYLDYLRYRTSRQTLSTRVEEAIRLYVGDEISLGRAAELAGMNYFQFEDLLRQRGIKAVTPLASKANAAHEHHMPVETDLTRQQLIAELDSLRAAGAFDHVDSLRDQYPSAALHGVSDQQVRAAIREAATAYKTDMLELADDDD